MKRIPAVLLATAVAVTLAGCTIVSGSSDPDPIDLSQPSVIASLCGDDAVEVAHFFEAAADAAPQSPHRQVLEDWGIDDPTDDEFLAEVQALLDERADTDCKDSDAGNTDTDTTEPDVSDAEASATLDNSIWAALDNWQYPPEYAALVTEFGFDTQVYDGQEFPEFQIGSAPNRSGRISTDAVLPAPAVKSVKQVFADILAYPDYGYHILCGLAQDETRIDGGKTILELNPVLEHFKDCTQINNWAQAAIDGSPKQQLRAAKMLAFGVMFFQAVGSTGIETDSTVINLHLNVVGDDGALSIDILGNPFKVREFERNPAQYTGEFYVFAVSFKGQTGCWLRIGINTSDGRYAVLPCGETQPPPPPGGGGCAPHCGTPECPTCGLDLKGGPTPGAPGITPAPQQLQPAAPPATVDTGTVDKIDTGTTLPEQEQQDVGGNLTE